MNFKFLIIFVLCYCQMTNAQIMDSVIVSPELLSQAKEIEIPQYDISRKSKYIIYLPMNYSKFLFTEDDKKLFFTLRDTLIERIDLVYTVFRRSKTFDQVELNRERYKMFQNHFPQAFNNNLIDWNLIAQNGTMEYEEAQGYFHGFVIYLKPHRVTTKNGVTIETVMDLRVDDPETKKLETNEEVAKIKTMLSESIATKIIKDTSYIKTKRRTWTGMYLAKSFNKRKKGIKFKEKRPGRQKEYIIKYKTEMKITDREVPDPDASPQPEKVIAKLTKDSVVFSVLKRTLERWEDYVIVQDVTGSMHPYLTQTLLYLQTHIKKNTTEKFVFFNDGDNKPDGKIGYSGGCYYVSADNAKEIEEMAFEAMRNGNGGKESENDIEAILYGITKFPKCKGVVLIADNFSRVRDFKLIPRLMKIGKPVRIVVCGIAKGDVVNLDYIYLAKYTKGSIHTINDDISDLATKKDGDTFKIGSQHFRVDKNIIKLIRQN
ncbi:MAG: hypothetical protein MK207_12525 [Saprospiraceae bacterium]|nr:hypothetical protein [Saprospiraceae bacterium]